MNKAEYTEIIKELAKDKKLMTGLATSGALGTGYLLMGKENRKKFKDKRKEVSSKTKEYNKKNKLTKKLLRGTGALAGTAIAVKSGKPIPQAVGEGGLAGLVAGDMIGATALPLKDLYTAHKREFGTAPDGKSIARVMATNTLPHAALWASVYGLKDGAMRKKLSDKLTNNISDVVDGRNETKQIFNKYKTNQQLLANTPPKQVQSELMKPMTKAGIGAVSAMYATMTPDMINKKILSIPGAYITPESIVQKKKQEIEQKSR